MAVSLAGAARGFGCTGGASRAATPAITGRAAVVLDGTTGRVIWERDADRQMPPASTTKIMTTMLALESGRLDRSFEVSPYAASQAPSKLGLRAGQRIDLEDLTYALMLKSANDAAVVVARTRRQRARVRVADEPARPRDRCDQHALPQSGTACPTTSTSPRRTTWR